MADIANENSGSAGRPNRARRSAATANHSWQALLKADSGRKKKGSMGGEEDMSPPMDEPAHSMKEDDHEGSPPPALPIQAPKAPSPLKTKMSPKKTEQTKIMSDEEELEQEDTELFPKPPPEKPLFPTAVKRRGRPPKDPSATPQPKKVKVEQYDDHFEEEEERDDEMGYGKPPKKCPPTCVMRCCVTESGVRLTAKMKREGLRGEDPDYRPGAFGGRGRSGSSDYGLSAKKPRAPYGSRKKEKETKQSIRESDSIVMKQRYPSQLAFRSAFGGQFSGGVAKPPNVVAVRDGKWQPVQANRPGPVVSSSQSSFNTQSTIPRRMVGGSGVTRPIIMPRMAGRSDYGQTPSLNNTERQSDPQLSDQVRRIGAQKVIPGSSVAEFNRIVEMLMVENSRLESSLQQEMEFRASHAKRIHQLEGQIASLSKELSVTMKAYQTSLLQHNTIAAPTLAAPPTMRYAVGGKPASYEPGQVIRAQAFSGQRVATSTFGPHSLVVKEEIVSTAESSERAATAEEKEEEEEEEERREENGSAEVPSVPVNNQGEGVEGEGNRTSQPPVLQKEAVATTAAVQRPLVGAQLQLGRTIPIIRSIPSIPPRLVGAGVGIGGNRLNITREEWDAMEDDEDGMYEEEYMDDEEETVYYDDEEEEDARRAEMGEQPDLD